jgi:hypothetical protein
MATGRQATLQLTAGNIATLSTAYTVPTGYYGIYNVSFTNTTSSSVNIAMAVAATTTPASSEYYEVSTTLVPYGVFERTGIVVAAGQNIVVGASGATNVNVYGIETSTS